MMAWRQKCEFKTMFKFGLPQVKIFKLYALLKNVKNVSLHPPMKHLSGFVENDVSAVPTTLSNSTSPESKALVTVLKFGMEALAVVPLRRKLGHHECVQRQIRRPFTVSKVEALVQAVEKLGTRRLNSIDDFFLEAFCQDGRIYFTISLS